MQAEITVVGAGLAGCEAAWQLAQAGCRVRLVEMKRLCRTPAQASDQLAELVCSNSLRSGNVQNAVGLLKEEMRRLGSLIVEAADSTRVPAGDALAVDRSRFSAHVTQAIMGHPRISLVDEAAVCLPGPDAPPTVVATGPLTSDALADEIRHKTGRDRLYFYDAIAPIVASDSVDRTVAFAASRYGKGAGADYLNCPLDRAQYETFVEALLGAEQMPLHRCEEPRYFDGCMPIEEIAARGSQSLRYGAMKPVGLPEPRSGALAYAVVQLRQEDLHGQAFNIVGFQTKLTHPEQRRVLRLIPGLQQVRILRYGAIHRNTFVDGPLLLDERMRLRSQPNLRFAGQITGVEGYVESAASGLLTGLLLASDLAGCPLDPPPPHTALGGLVGHVTGASRPPGRRYEPQNINWALLPPRPASVPRRDMKSFRVARARAGLEAWARQGHLSLAALSTAEAPAAAPPRDGPSPAP